MSDQKEFCGEPGSLKRQFREAWNSGEDPQGQTNTRTRREDELQNETSSSTVQVSNVLRKPAVMTRTYSWAPCYGRDHLGTPNW